MLSLLCYQLLPEKMGFVSANTLYLKSKSKTYITTGAKRKLPIQPAQHTDVEGTNLAFPELDHILGGGLETMSVTEVCNLVLQQIMIGKVLIKLAYWL